MPTDLETALRFRAAVQAQDHAGLDPLFADDVRFFSPMKFRPFEGRAMVLGLFGVLLRTFEDFRYVGELTGPVERDDGAGEDGEVLIFRARVGDVAIHGIDLLQFDADGLIDQFTVMVRPHSALVAVSGAVLAGLVADGLVPPPSDG